MKRATKIALAGAGLVIFTFFALYGAGRQIETAEPSATTTRTSHLYVTGDVVNVRAGATTDAEVVRRVKLNDRVRVISRSGEWVEVEVEGAPGFIHQSLLNEKQVARKAPPTPPQRPKEEQAASQPTAEDADKREATSVPERPRQARAPKKPEGLSDAECRQSLECLANKFHSHATVYCAPAIERMAKFSSKWTNTGWFEQKFTHHRWRDQASGTVTFIGDKAQFQNGFGAWQNMIYECDVNTVENKITDVRVREGRLPN